MSIKEWLHNLTAPKSETRSFGLNINSSIPANTTPPLGEIQCLSITSVYCAVNVIANNIAGLPLVTYRKTRKGKSVSRNHPLTELLQHTPNPDMSSFVFRSTSMHHTLLWGDSFAEIVRDGAGRPVELYPILPNRVQILRNNNSELIYQFFMSPEGESKTLSQQDVFHIPALSYDGLRGLPPITICRRAFELTRNLEVAGDAFFKNGQRPSGALKTPGRLSEQARINLQSSYAAMLGGAENTGKVPVLEEGLDWIQLSIPPGDAAYLESRQFQLGEIARMFNVPPPFLQDLSRATWANLETLNTFFVQNTLMPWCQKWEAEIRRKLLMPDEVGKYFVEFDFDKLLRGDIKSRTLVYASAIQNGWMNRNEVRAEENMNSVEGLDDFLVPSNLQTQADKDLATAQVEKALNAPEPVVNQDTQDNIDNSALAAEENGTGN